MGFACAHATKMGTGGGGLGTHIDRKYKVMPKNIDPERMHLNKDYVAIGSSLVSDVKRRIKEGYKSVNKDGTPRALRSDAVLLVGNIVSGSHLDMKELEKQGRIDEWALANLEFFKRKYGEKNIVRFTLHMDEKTPHIHCLFVPLDKDGRLTAKEIVGDKKKLSYFQSDYAAAMKPFGLERGLKNTRVKHTTTRQYYAKVENAAEEATVETRMGIPKAGEIERVQDVARKMQAEITRVVREAEILKNTDKDRHAQFEEGKRKLLEFEKKVNEKLERVTAKESQLEQVITERIAQAQESQKGRIDFVRDKAIKDTYKSAFDLANKLLKDSGLKQRFNYNVDKGTVSLDDPNLTRSIKPGQGIGM